MNAASNCIALPCQSWLLSSLPMKPALLTPYAAGAGHLEVWEFLSESSEAYGPASEVGFFKGLVRDANTSVRHAVGDMVDNIDTTRRKILSNVPTVTLPDAPWGRLGGGMAGDGLPRRSSFSNSNMAVRQNSQVGILCFKLDMLTLLSRSTHFQEDST